MLLIEGNGIKKYYGDRLIFNLDNLKIYAEDRIGIVGRNGVGKTTLMNILSGRIQPDEGLVKCHGSISYISQLEEPICKETTQEIASTFKIRAIWSEHMSGGEKTRFKIADALTNNSSILFADEPTSNVDMDGITLIEEMFQGYKGALLLVSHDRNFLDTLCNKILEIENGMIKVYSGNYSDYKDQKIQQRQRAELEYNEYIKEKKRLEGVVHQTKDKVKSIKRAPKRMGSSEARLHKMGGQKAKTNLERMAKNVEKRIEHLEVKEKPKELPGIKLNMLEGDRLYSKIIVEGENLNKSFGKKKLFKSARFHIKNGSKVALIGPNGCGKSTLIKMITENDESIKIAQGAKLGYFNQDLNILNANRTILENVMEESIYPEHLARTLLASLLFKEDDVHKKIHVLSGGERVKVSFAMILLQDINLLVLDEPTNYMDIDGLEAIEGALKNYEQTILFVSHDRHFVDEVADHVLAIENQKIIMFTGNYSEYLNSKDKDQCKQDEEVQMRKIILKNRLSEVISKLSMPSKEDDVAQLDIEYYQILGELKMLPK
ncbi:macrolide transport system ATP-binding/permease protein [Alkalibaculum bacchi]|uniref:Macrolide transport system ATP-binding/permease protein n=1 Tax=Alkalibaculum bacchi TaxID=645887 RepID=A0A366HYF7_9FIRM|nr:ABC-F type ribosomal protection protein [Alkalibaculum bacchi]RBP59064.1 macrolide transport system ATP-binding/permease protein [Alkalibaculum bacchi]